MIIADTNVVSEMMRDRPDPTVRAWALALRRTCATTVTLAEIEYGIARLPLSRRRDRLARAAVEIFADFADTLLPFDARAARRYGPIVAGREAAGRPIGVADAQIAAICASHGATLATRNTADFIETGIDLVNPWE